MKSSGCILSNLPDDICKIISCVIIPVHFCLPIVWKCVVIVPKQSPLVSVFFFKSYLEFPTSPAHQSHPSGTCSTPPSFPLPYWFKYFPAYIVLYPAFFKCVAKVFPSIPSLHFWSLHPPSTELFLTSAIGNRWSTQIKILWGLQDVTCVVKVSACKDAGPAGTAYWSCCIGIRKLCSFIY